MLLVLISMGIATVLTTAYLASRDNSAAIGRNIADSYAARWAAFTGIELTAAIMETETAWQEFLEAVRRFLGSEENEEGQR